MSRPAVLVGAAAEPAADGAAALGAWLRGQSSGRPPRLSQLRPTPPGAPPRGALVAVVGLAPWTGDRLGRLLSRRRDLAAVAVLGQPPAPDWPEYQDDAARAALDRLLAACRLVLVPGEPAAARLRRALPAGATNRVAVDGAIPSALAGAAPVATGEEPPPYVLATGPAAARANTPLLLHLWRDALARGVAMPRLVLLGGRGAQVEEVAPLLDWNEALRGTVAEAPPLTAPQLAALVAGACAVLAPDFCAPDVPLLRDAAALGRPVIAADTPEARALGVATRLSPIDGPGWRAAILAAAAASPTPPPSGPTLPGWPALLDRLGEAWPA